MSSDTEQAEKGEKSQSANKQRVFKTNPSDLSDSSDEEFEIKMNSIPFNRLKGRENYSEWKVGAKAHLIIKVLWKYCQPALSESAEEKDKEKDLKAIGEITLLLEPTNHTYV